MKIEKIKNIKIKKVEKIKKLIIEKDFYFWLKVFDQKLMMINGGIILFWQTLIKSNVLKEWREDQ